MLIRACLEDKRPDMKVSLWLQAKARKPGLAALPVQVVNAYRADRFLVEVNSGGFEGLFRWEFEDVPNLAEALRAVGLEDMADALTRAMGLLPGGWPDTQDALAGALSNLDEDDLHSTEMEELSQRVIGASARVEQATHAYVRANLPVFESLDVQPQSSWLGKLFGR